MISGVDEWRWVAYCFFDSYFDAKDKDHALQHQRDITEGTYADPSQNNAIGKPMQDPREYFLRVLSIRLSDVVLEWERVTRNLDEKVGGPEMKFRGLSEVRAPCKKADDCMLTKRQSHETPLPQPRARSWSQKGGPRTKGEYLIHTLNVVVQVRNLAASLSKQLSKTLNVVADFVVSFQDSKEPSKTRQSFLQIRESFKRLESVRESLDSKAHACRRMEREVGHRPISNPTFV